MLCLSTSFHLFCLCFRFVYGNLFVDKTLLITYIYEHFLSA